MYGLENLSSDSWPSALSMMPWPTLRQALGGGNIRVQAGKGLTMDAVRLPTGELEVFEIIWNSSSSVQIGTLRSKDRGEFPKFT